MSTDLKLVLDGDRAVEIHRGGGGLLLRYVYRPDTEVDESSRPYAHPVCTLAGEVLTNFRPNDHPWHHGLSFTINCLSGHNFWGGATYRKADGYQMRGDHGTQQHTGWLEQGANYLAHTLDWRVGEKGELLLQEQRTLTIKLLSPQAWLLHWVATLKNVSGRTLELGQYHSHEGLAGSHYSGLQFRGARDLLDDHGDKTVGIFADGGLSGEAAVHGAASPWMEWRGQKDVTQRRVHIRFAHNAGPLHGFVRRHNPLAAFPFQYERDLPLLPGATLAVDHTLTFTDT
jgi:hypothetical protein